MTERFDVPESFGEYLIQYANARAEASKREQEKQRKEAAAEKRRVRVHKQRTLQNLPYAERIFSWVAQFREGESGKRAIACVPTCSRPDRALVFFEYHPRGVITSTRPTTVSSGTDTARGQRARSAQHPHNSHAVRNHKVC